MSTRTTTSPTTSWKRSRCNGAQTQPLGVFRLTVIYARRASTTGDAWLTSCLPARSAALGWAIVTDVEIRPLGPDDDMDAQVDLGQRAYGAATPDVWEAWRKSAAAVVSDGAFLGAFVSGRPAGAAVFHDMRQWWHGKPMPMAGVASVKIAPEYRGRGIGRRLMTELLGLIAERGYPVSALYPATMPIYRSLGWELAGGRYHMAVPSRELRSLLAPDAALPGEAASVSVAASPATTRALWSVVASHSSTAKTVHGRLAPYDPLFSLTRERDVAITKR